MEPTVYHQRSNFRESLIQLAFMFTRYRRRHRALPILDFFMRKP